MAFISESVRPYPERSIFSDHQKAKLEAMFRKKKYPSFKEKATLAATLDIDIKKVQVWTSNYLLFCNFCLFYEGLSLSKELYRRIECSIKTIKYLTCFATVFRGPYLYFSIVFFFVGST